MPKQNNTNTLNKQCNQSLNNNNETESIQHPQHYCVN